MPSSSGKKPKHSQNSKKSKAIQRQREGVKPPAPSLPVSQAAPQAAETTVTTNQNAPAAREPRATVAIEYPYLSSELKQIGILAAVIVIILIVLAIVL